MKTYSVEEVTAALGITPRTLHYYEEVGLIREVRRTEGGHRVYEEPTLERLRHILRLKIALGISLQDISDILEAENNLEQLKVQYRSVESESDKWEVLDRGEALLQSVVDAIDEKIGKLETLRRTFNERLENVNRLKKK